MNRSESYELEAHDSELYGWSVAESTGQRWWPSDEALGAIESAADPAAEALRMCREEPMRGEWRS